MAGQRKLLSEIDRTLKKVSEGVDVFNDIWEKVYSATTQSQKEKHESDLKKEIKKLQRFRDQIKNWIGNSDVKDKRPLVDARKLIEQKMEEFKVCEKETKTKAYSKEGLAQIERLDPAERAKQSTRNWIQDCLTQLNEQMEAFDCDLERLQTQSKGRNKNKQEVQDLETALARHKWHILKLEQVTRLLDNDAIDPSVVDELKEDIEYYLEANQEPDFFETYGDDDIYEDLDLDSLGAAVQVGLSSDQDGMLDDSVASDQIKEATNGNGSSSLQPPSTSSTNRSAAKTPKKSASCSAITGIGRPGMVKPIELKTSVMTSGKSVSKVDDDQILSDDKGRTRSASSRGKIVVPSDELLSVERKPSIETKTPPDLNKERSNTPTTSTSGNSGFDVSVLMNDERIQLLQMVDESFSFIPESRDSEKVNKYVPRNTYPTSASFPSTPMSLFENSNFYEKLDLDTLFFIFYYQQGSYQQFLAAKELKRRTWGYHKKYKTWFKRHEEPQITGEDYEQGTFVYFDYETGWCQRIKTEFTFEYSYLEDELL